MRLNFKMSELIHSDTAIVHNINNMPDIQALDNLLNLIFYLLQPIRDKFGAIKVTSGYRCPKLNKLVGGVPTSNHVKGCAVDIQNPNMQAIYNYVVTHLDYDECLFETNKQGIRWLHISYVKGKNRKIHNANYKA